MRVFGYMCLCVTICVRPRARAFSCVSLFVWLHAFVCSVALSYVRFWLRLSMFGCLRGLVRAPGLVDPRGAPLLRRL